MLAIGKQVVLKKILVQSVKIVLIGWSRINPFIDLRQVFLSTLSNDDPGNARANGREGCVRLGPIE